MGPRYLSCASVVVAVVVVVVVAGWLAGSAKARLDRNPMLIHSAQYQRTGAIPSEICASTPTVSDRDLMLIRSAQYH